MVQPDENDPQQVEADENLELPKETLEDLDAPEEAAAEAKGGNRNGPTSTPWAAC